jgi:di/tricarboxylate transporter
MTPEILITLIILGFAILLFISEKLRSDLIALMVMLALVIGGILSPLQAVAGFSSPVVIVSWSMFILSAGLVRTGVATGISEFMLRFTRKGEGRLTAVIMLAGGFISGYTGMNNTGTLALMLPVAMEVSRRARLAASRVLLPMLMSVLIGGMSLLISNPINLLVSEIMAEAGLPPLQMFDFTPMALIFLFLAVSFTLLVGRKRLPARQTPRPLAMKPGVARQAALEANHIADYGLEERLATLIIPADNPLVGKTLAESRIGTALGLNILSLERKSGERLAPDTSLQLESDDRLLVLGRLDRLLELKDRPPYEVVDDPVTVTHILSAQVGLAEFKISPGSKFAGQSVVDLGFRQNYGVNVLAIQRADVIRRTNLQSLVLRPGDVLLVQGPVTRLEDLRQEPGFRHLSKDEARRYQLEDRLLYLHIPENSALAGKTLAQGRFGSAYGLTVLDIIRGGEEWLMPSPETTLIPGDLLVVQGRPLDIEVVRGLRALKIESHVKMDLDELEAGPFSFVEVVLSPYSRLAGRTLRSLHFREKFGLSVLSIWRGERAYRTDLGEMQLRYGDALLCYGPRDRFAFLAREADFIVLETGLQEPPRRKLAPLAILILAGVIGSVMLNLLPLSIAALLGVVLMVVSGCLTMDEAYLAIEWKAIFLIAGMLSLGTALQQTGAAAFLTGGLMAVLGGYGPLAVLAGLFLVTVIATQFIPDPVVAVLMAPLAINSALSMDVAPFAFVLAVAYAAACSFLTPVAHPANVLVVSPGGYRFSDFVKFGLPVVAAIFVTCLLLLPVLFPF